MPSICFSLTRHYVARKLLYAGPSPTLPARTSLRKILPWPPGVRAASNATASEGEDSTSTASPASSSSASDTTVAEAETVQVDMLPKWASYSDRLDPLIINSMQTIFKYDRVTKVQATILDLMPIQNDMLVRSKTGTGKTLAFLVPALQRALERYESLAHSSESLKTFANRNASTLVISPTRELANQITTEARRLSTSSGPGIRALCVVGGDSKRDQLKLMRRQRNDFVVATPGRLLDLLQTVPDFENMIKGVHTLILDEADTLLEMGFRKELERILEFLPEKRQTYMFSATVSRDIQRIARDYLKRDHTFLNTVSKDDQDSHKAIKQEYIIRPMNEQIRIVLSLIISQQLRNPNAKIIVFLQTTKMTMLYATVFKVLRRLYPNQAFQQFDIHAQRSQDSRTKVSQAFRTAKAGSVLFTTDVSARGVDYPDVTQVIQVGSAGSRDLYIHRLGRTGRAGKLGEGVMILQPFEAEFLHTLGKDIPIVEKDFPDSEIALGTAQSQCFSLAYKLTPQELLQDTYISIGGALIPRVRDFRAQKNDIISQMSAWFSDIGGDRLPIPQLSPKLLGAGSGGRRGGQNFSSNSDYPRSHGEAPSYSGRGRPNTRFGGDRDWRPQRPSEMSHFSPSMGGKRKDFSRPRRGSDNAEQRHY